MTEQDAFVKLYTERLQALEAAETRLCFGRLDLADGTPPSISIDDAVPVIEGDIDHRDYVLSASEKAAGNVIQICISRALGPRLVLDL